MRFQEKIGTLTKTSSTQVQLSGSSLVKLGGQFFSLSSPTLVTSTTGIGGLDTGAVAASTMYYVYAVYNGSTTGIVASTSNQSPTGFTRYKKVGAFYTDDLSGIGIVYTYRQVVNTKTYQIKFSGSQNPTFTNGIITGHTPSQIDAPLLTPTTSGNPSLKFPAGYYGKRICTIYGYCRADVGSSASCVLSMTSTSPSISNSGSIWSHQASSTTGQYGGITNTLTLEAGFYNAQEYPVYGSFTTTTDNVAYVKSIECQEFFPQPDWKDY